MARPADWASRKFEFEFEPDIYPAILMRLRGTPARLDELFRDADDAKVRHRPADGKWSALEHAGHLIHTEVLWDARLSDYLAGVEVLTPADMSNAATFEADYNARGLADVLGQFRSVRQAFLDRLDSLNATDFARTALHPRLKVPMRLVDGLYFSAEHDDHELAWIWDLLRA
jgi:hypothetical protein